MKRAMQDLWRRAFGPRLRCRPGDLCLVIGQVTRYAPITGEPYPVPYRMGLIVEVVRHDGEVWELKQPIQHTYALRIGSLTTSVTCIADELLQPLPRDGAGLDEQEADPPPPAAKRPQLQEA